jgi:hypothetical protein
MRLPNAEKAIIATEKLRDYLLNPRHPRGGSKARLLIELGFHPDHWEALEAALRQQHLVSEINHAVESDFGVRYDIVAPLATPSGRVMVFRSIWQIDTGTPLPRLITMYPV